MLFHGIYVLNERPLIVALWGDDAWETVANNSPKPDYFLWHNAWFQGTVGRMAKLKYRFYQLKKKGITPLQMTNSILEDRYRQYFGLKGFHCSSYVFTNENKYPILSEVKRYEAVYAAQLKEFKRISLAQEIEKLFILTYKSSQQKWDLHLEYPEVKHAEFNTKWVDASEKNKLFSASHVGLCLSKEEGPMLASLEYMLNGLPVVSTESKGGRDEYYSPDYCSIVHTSPRAVKEGVESLIKQNLSPEKIRAQTVIKLNQDRARYVDYLCDFIYHDCGVHLNPDQMRTHIFQEPESNFKNLKEYSMSILKTPQGSGV